MRCSCLKLLTQKKNFFFLFVFLFFSTCFISFENSLAWTEHFIIFTETFSTWQIPSLYFFLMKNAPFLKKKKKICVKFIQFSFFSLFFDNLSIAFSHTHSVVELLKRVDSAVSSFHFKLADDEVLYRGSESSWQISLVWIQPGDDPAKVVTLGLLPIIPTWGGVYDVCRNEEREIFWQNERHCYFQRSANDTQWCHREKKEDFSWEMMKSDY